MSSPISDALFTKTQQRVLGLLYGQPEARFYTNEIVRRLNMGRGAVTRELERLAASGILATCTEGRQRYYQANRDCSVYPELVSLTDKILIDPANRPMLEEDSLLIGGTIPVSRNALADLARRFYIRQIHLFGSAARHEMGPDSDVDILVDFEHGKAPSLGGMVELQRAFSQLFNGRRVDVATRSILENPYRRRAIEKDMEALYAA